MGMNTRADVEHLIARAFRDTPFPGEDALIVSGADGAYGDSVAEIWRGRTAEAVDAHWLARYGEDALCFMTPGAIRYYMSAFLRGAVVDFEAMDVASDALVSVLTRIRPGDEFARRHQAIAAAFTGEEARAIAAVLEWLEAKHLDDLVCEDDDAACLRESIVYWNDKGRSQLG
jgi:hypothetical protein